jgi:hypothetical protein
MPKEAIQVLYHHYKMELLGGDKPRIKITLNKNDEPREYFLRELPHGSPVSTIQVSTDSLLPNDQGKLTVMLSVQAKPTPEVLARAGKTSEDDIITICNLSVNHPSTTTERFFSACEGVVSTGGKVPVTILNSKSKVLCVMQVEIVNRFVWKKMMQQMEVMRNTAMNPQKPN